LEFVDLQDDKVVVRGTCKSRLATQQYQAWEWLSGSEEDLE